MCPPLKIIVASSLIAEAKVRIYYCVGGKDSFDFILKKTERENFA